ncbi:hypothetical protein [Baekduia sp. Peel2402]|uniref:hypothetical protein n=1 Tax=Baekduia sp. Peel2402 TaxID=3458296 RepID=UPI00403E510D
MTLVPQNRANLVAAAEAAVAARAAQRRRFRVTLPIGRLTRRTLALAAIGAALPVGVGAAVVVLVQETPPKEQPRTAPLGAGPDGRLIDRTPLARPPESLLAGYSRLRDAPSAEERDDAQMRGWARNLRRRFGLDPSAARVLTRIDGNRLWLVPGNGFTCLAVEEPTGGVNGGCDTEAVVLRDGVRVNNGTSIYGVLPDGIDKIEVTDDDGFRHVEPVSHNAYVLRNASATVRYPVGDRIEMFRVIGSSG